MKYYIIAGEASGDLHAANLMNRLKLYDSKAEFRFWGGDMMLHEGGVMVKHYRDLAFMGFFEVLMNMPEILKNFKLCKNDLLSYKPDVLILVDYPGFNLRIAEFAKKNGIRVFYYISPQIWAWRQSRVKIIKANVERMFVILPFEKDFYERFDYSVDYVGHPLLDAIEQLGSTDSLSELLKKDVDESKNIIALIPGSRKQEISIMLPVMLDAAKNMDDFHIVIAGAPSQTEEFYQQFIGDEHNVSLVFGKTYDILKLSRAALVTSGTATLETALLRVPQAVCYKAGKLSYHIARRVIKVGYISLVNLIMEKPVVGEFIQYRMNVNALRSELLSLLNDENRIEKMKTDYDELKDVLGGSGASEKTASLMYKYLVNNDVS